MSNSWYGPVEPAPDAGWSDPPPRKGFFTDTSICIGCKACEVACKEWNAVPDDGMQMLGSSYDNSGALGGSTWRHVMFIEQPKPLGDQDPGFAGTAAGPISLSRSAAASRLRKSPSPSWATRAWTSGDSAGTAAGLAGALDGRSERGIST